MFTTEEIEAAKRIAPTTQGHHEHPDCILIACQWLSAQKLLTKPNTHGWSRPLKHIIESWGGRYVSTDDVIVAAHLLGLKGTYPLFNLSSRFVRPSPRRLAGIGEAMRHKGSYEGYDDRETYVRAEH